MANLGELAMWRDHVAEILITIGATLALVGAVFSGWVRSRRQMRAAEAAHKAMRRSSGTAHES